MNILLVDSDPAVIQALLPALKALPGHEIRVATHGEKALEHATEMGGVHCLITEVVLDPMNGFTLRNKLQNRYPGLRPIFMSAYDMSGWKEHLLGAITVSKPLKTSEMLVAVARVARQIERGVTQLVVVKKAEPEPSAAAEAVPAPEPARDEPRREPEAFTAESAPPEAEKSAPEPESAPILERGAPEPPGGISDSPRGIEKPPGGIEESPKPEPEPPSSQPEPPTTLPEPPIAPEPVAIPSPIPAQTIPRAVATQPTATPVIPRAVATQPTATPVIPRAVAAQPTATPAVPLAIPAPRLAPTTGPTPAPPAPRVGVPAATPPAPRPVPRPVAVPPPAAPTPDRAPDPRAAVSSSALAGAAMTMKINIPPARIDPTAPKPVRTAKRSEIIRVPLSHASPAAATPPTQAQAAVPAPAAIVPRAPASGIIPPPTAPTAEDDPLVGQVIANYRIVRPIGDGEWGKVYEAVQTSMERHVAMKILSPEMQENPERKKEFIANASAKANVQHPFILSVYEAGEANGHCYYTHEFVDGLSLAQMAASGQTLADPMALKAIRTASEALAHLETNHIAHTELSPAHLYIGRDGHPRVGNVATWQPVEGLDVRARIAALAETVRAALPAGRATSPGLDIMLTRMADAGPAGYGSWAALLQAVHALEPKVVPADAFKLSAQDVAAIRAVEDAKRRQKRSALISVIGIVVLVLSIAGVLAWKFWPAESVIPETLVKIPAGEFIYQEGEKKFLPDYWIDEHEVTIGQYGKFLTALSQMRKAGDGSEKQFDHPKQPPTIDHTPENWDAIHGRAKSGELLMSVLPISLDRPVSGVSWWDAYAYAQWRGRRLPTEEEWEKAARGTDGNQYPWGSEPDPKKANTGADYHDDPRKSADYDGHARWAPVGAVKGDRSPYRLTDMGGNVSEWTSSWEPPVTEENAIGKFPVVRGGSFRWPEAPLTKRIPEWFPESRQDWIGFRTATSSDPAETTGE